MNAYEHTTAFDQSQSPSFPRLRSIRKTSYAVSDATAVGSVSAVSAVFVVSTVSTVSVVSAVSNVSAGLELPGFRP